MQTIMETPCGKHLQISCGISDMKQSVFHIHLILTLAKFLHETLLQDHCFSSSRSPKQLLGHRLLLI